LLLRLQTGLFSRLKRLKIQRYKPLLRLAKGFDWL